MKIVERLQQFLLHSCELTQFQVWKNIHEDRFSLVLSQGIENHLPPSYDRKVVGFYDYFFQFHERDVWSFELREYYQ